MIASKKRFKALFAVHHRSNNEHSVHPYKINGIFVAIEQNIVIKFYHISGMFIMSRKCAVVSFYCFGSEWSNLLNTKKTGTLTKKVGLFAIICIFYIFFGLTEDEKIGTQRKYATLLTPCNKVSL